MNLTVKLFFLILFLSQTCLAQHSTKTINDTWKNLKTQLQSRTDLVAGVTNTLTKSKQVDQEELKKAKHIAADLFRHVDTLQTLDSLSVSFANYLNTNLTQALARSLMTLERDRKHRNSVPVRDLLVQLEAIENRIMVAKMDYNHACTETNRPDLFFGSNAKAKAPEIKF